MSGTAGPAARTTAKLAAAMLVAAGGLVLGIGSVLSFVEVRARSDPAVSDSVGGIELGRGRLYLAVGILLVGCAAGLLRARTWRQTLALFVLVAAGAVVVRGMLDLFTLENSAFEAIAREEAVAQGIPDAEIRGELEQEIALDPGIGLLLVPAGGMIALAGGIVAVATPAARSRNGDPPPDEEPPKADGESPEG